MQCLDIPQLDDLHVILGQFLLDVSEEDNLSVLHFEVINSESDKHCLGISWSKIFYICYQNYVFLYIFVCTVEVQISVPWVDKSLNVN